MSLLKIILRWLLKRFYRVRVSGMEHYLAAGQRVLIVANHTSFLDALLLVVFLPDKLTFAVNTHIAQRWWLRPLLKVVDFFSMDPTNPYSIKSLIRYLQEDKRVAIFPEGRITVTGSLMKIYPGPGLVADKSQAMILPVRIDGAQYTPFSRLRGRVRLRMFPTIQITFLPPRQLAIAAELRGRNRRKAAGKLLSDIMTEMMFATSQYRSTLFDVLLDARKVHGGAHAIAEDIERKAINYNQLISRSYILGNAVARQTAAGEYVGVLLPNSLATIYVFLGLHARGRVPAMLNYTVGAQSLISACETARIATVYTSRRFIQAARLEKSVERLGARVKLVYLEDLRETIGLTDKLKGLLAGYFARLVQRRLSSARPDDAAVVMFTSGSEGAPKGVVLSHANLLANRQQIAARVDFSAQDIILNALPLFHSFGLTAGTLLPLLSGMKVFFYPSPLHYRIVPEMAYEVNATILFGTNTFLAGYARFAHPYDFYSVRYIFAGAEKLKEETRRLWAEKFGVQIFEGYGATETSPVLATNTPIDSQPGTVGRFLPGVEYRLQPVPGVNAGGRLSVRGPNIMLGYLKAENPGQLIPPVTELGSGWYDTGDIVSIDADGFVTICGRVKRFAKIGGEMVSLTVVEDLATRTWPKALHACINIPDFQKGEQLVLVTTYKEAARADIAARAKADGIGELHVPKKIIYTANMPLLGSGKIDYPAVAQLVEQGLPSGERATS